VETIGCINLSQESDEKEIIKSGVGKFRNPNIPNIKILAVHRLTRIQESKDEKMETEAAEKSDTNNTAENIEKTNVVRVIFEGNLLPDYVEVNKLLLRVSMFKRKLMFCELCQRYNHTSKLCVNKARCQICFEIHSTEKCPEKEKVIVCLHCKGNHPTGYKFCPRRIFIERKENIREKAAKQRTFAEMLMDLEGDEPDMPGEDQSKYTEPMKFGNLRKRLYDREFPEMKRPTPQPKRVRKETPETKEMPPGFKASQYINNDDTILSFLYSFVDKLGFSEAINNIIKEFVVPFIYQIIQNAIGTFTESMKTSFTSPFKESTSSTPHKKSSPNFSAFTSSWNSMLHESK
jgi:hypothetical protein